MSSDFEPVDMNKLRNSAMRSRAIQREARAELTPMKAQAAEREGAARSSGGAGAPLERTASGWSLHGSAVRDGMAMELYTNSSNGWLKGEVAWSGEREERPALLITLWNPWGGRDQDGLPPRVGSFQAEIAEGAICRWTAAMPKRID